MIWRVVCASTLALGSVVPAYAAPLPPLLRVNAPYFTGDIVYGETAIFWFGRVTQTENYADVRVGYNDDELYVNMIVFDRRLWYNESPSPSDLTNWDSASLYVDMDGNVGNTPDTNAYRFDGQLNWWEPRANWQAAYRGNGAGWATATVPFTTTTDFAWESDTEGGFNNNRNNRGWGITFHIPFASLGLSGPPTQGTLWGLGVVVHDRDAAPPASVTQETWPTQGMASDKPATWGQLRFGLPAYSSQSAVARGTTIIRNKLNGAVVVDGVVGGNTLCGDGADYWTEWGDKNYAGAMQFNIQNQAKVSDWPCSSKYYVTFPLTSTLPAGKVIISATLTLYQKGHMGDGDPSNPGQPANIQVLTAGQDWAESTLTWNSAPMARENISYTLVPLMPSGVPLDPGVPRSWDVSRAVAEAYASGDSLRLALYSSESPLNTGKVFWSSDHDEYPALARPTLTVVWGGSAAEPMAEVNKTVWPATPPASGAPITYTIAVLGNGLALTLTDNVPTPLSFPGSVSLIGSGVVSRDSSARRITWVGTPLVGAPVTLTYVVSAVVSGPKTITNTTVLTDSAGKSTSDTALCIVAARKVWLPLILRQ